MSTQFHKVFAKTRKFNVDRKIAVWYFISKEERIKNAGFITHDKTGSKWRLQPFTEKVFYKALDDAGISNPIITVAGETPRHKYTPHSCRHTFATLMKRAAGSDKDKLALIGHASDEQLRDYQDVHYEDLQRITDAI